MSPKGGNVKVWRARRGLTQAQVGERIGSDGPRVGRIEAGKENPTLETLDKLAAALEIDVLELFEEARPEKESNRDVLGGVGDGPGLADSLRRAITEYEQTGEAPKDWRGDVLVAIFALTRALQRPAAVAADVGNKAAKAQ